MAVADAGTAVPSIEAFAATEAGAWSNSYLISGKSEAILFDVFMLRSDAAALADKIAQSGRTLKAVMISHAHPDHFMALDVIASRFPETPIVATRNVVADIKADGPRMFSMLHSKLGPEGPTRLVVPSVLEESTLGLEGNELHVVEFGECESKHIAALHIPALKAFLSADLIYNDAHLYLQEQHLDSWLERLEELEEFAVNRISTIYPGHGSAAGLELIARNRAYMHEFASAVKSGDASTAVQRMLAKYPGYHVRQFLTMFSIPAYFPTHSSN
jgi:glyoxylase-like metal-dependent hydrolase (beta-lactamase superfamily II)